MKAVATRTRQTEDVLRERGRDYQLTPDPVAVLREILTQNRAPPARSSSGQRRPHRMRSTSTTSPRT